MRRASTFSLVTNWTLLQIVFFSLRSMNGYQQQITKTIRNHHNKTLLVRSGAGLGWPVVLLVQQKPVELTTPPSPLPPDEAQGSFDQSFFKPPVKFENSGIIYQVIFGHLAVAFSSAAVRLDLLWYQLLCVQVFLLIQIFTIDPARHLSRVCCRGFAV